MLAPTTFLLPRRGDLLEECLDMSDLSKGTARRFSPKAKYAEKARLLGDGGQSSYLVMVLHGSCNMTVLRFHDQEAPAPPPMEKIVPKLPVPQ